jgi:hypothetical protein
MFNKNLEGVLGDALVWFEISSFTFRKFLIIKTQLFSKITLTTNQTTHLAFSKVGKKSFFIFFIKKLLFSMRFIRLLRKIRTFFTYRNKSFFFRR